MGKKIKYNKGDFINGIEFVKEIETTKQRMAIFKCPICKNDWATRISKIKTKKVGKCKYCSSKINRSKIKNYHLSGRRGELESLHKQVFRYLKKSATQRCYDFSLTLKDVVKLTSSNCFYCGKKPENKINNNKFTYNYNGIDRKNNNKGYLLENCVSCCRVCNVGKSTLSYDEWILHLESLVKYRINI